MLCRGPPRDVRAMTRPDFPRTLAEFQGRFASEEGCRRYLVACRWPDGFRCPRCGEPDAYGLTGRELLQCRACRHQTSATAGTVPHRTHVPLRLWFAAAYLVTTHTPGFSAVQLRRQLGRAGPEPGWTMRHGLRGGMLRREGDRLSGVVEVDEAYVGGLEEGRRGGATAASRSSSARSRCAAAARAASGSRSSRTSPRPRWCRSSRPRSIRAAPCWRTAGRATPRCARATTTGRRPWGTRGTRPCCS